MKIKLSELSYADLAKVPVWAAIGDYAEEVDAELMSVELGHTSRVPKSLKEVWCLCSAIFADKSEHLACSMCRADSEQGPMLWTVWNGERDIPLMVPPAPPPVLSKSGPIVFARLFGRSIESVFPLTISVRSKFEVAPEVRSVRIGVSGVV